MTLNQAKKSLIDQGKLDERQLFSYATLSGNIYGNTFQNLVAVVFDKEFLSLYHAKTDGSVGDLYVQAAYNDMENLVIKHRFLYSFTQFTAEGNQFRFYSYNKSVFIKGFSDAGLITGKK